MITPVDDLLNLLFKIFCKAFEYVLRLSSWLRLGFQSPVTSLLDFETAAQKAAYLDTSQLPRSKQTVKSDHSLDSLREASDSNNVIVVIPYRDEWTVTARCLAGLAKQQGLGQRKVDVWLIDNDSKEAATKEGRKALDRQSWPTWMSINHRTFQGVFNFSAINNWAVEVALGEGFGKKIRENPDASPQSNGLHSSKTEANPWLLLLNNDIEFVEKTSISNLLNTAVQLPNLGGLGARLNYPNGKLQHLFAAPGVKIVAGHPLRGSMVPRDAEYLARPRPVAAVTAATFLTRAKVFAEVGGFDERLSTVGQDIDLCLKIQKLGLTIWMEPRIVLIHHESLSRRGKTIDRRQVSYLYEKWGDYLLTNPFYSKRFSRWSEYPSLTLGEGRYPWWRLLKD